jgi:hypothetical protein
MSRYSTDMLYTFEFIVVIFFFILLAILAKKSGERNSLIVYTFTGILHSVIELVAEGLGVRVISETYLFGRIYLSYPFLPFILGFFEGGLFCLLAYHLVRILINRDRFSLKFFSLVAISFLILITLGALRMQSAPSTFTRRALMEPGSLILLAICYAISIGYFVFNKNVTSAHRKSFLYFYLSLIVVTLLMVVPLHIAGIRFIEVFDGSYVYASIPEQILIMYGYSLAFEAAGFFLPFYVIIYHFNLIDLKGRG